MPDDVLLLTVPEAARLLRIGRNLAYGLVARGEIPAVRFGRTIRVPRTALEQLFEVAGERAEARDSAVSVEVLTDGNHEDRPRPLSRGD